MDALLAMSHVAFLQGATTEASSSDTITAGQVAIGAALVTLGGILGAIVERARSRSGYLARRYRDHLALLLSLTEASRSPMNVSKVEGLREKVLSSRAKMDADVWLFGNGRVREQLTALNEELMTPDWVRPSDFDERVAKLALAFRGPRYWLLAPQKRWFGSREP